MSSISRMESQYQTLRSVIRSRKTMKVLADTHSPVELEPTSVASHRERVLEAIKDSGWAPFHYPRNLDSMAEPWRFHVLWDDACRSVSERFSDWFPDAKSSNKLPAMLAACGALVIVNWIPQGDSGESDEKLKQINEEHLAATSAAVQNLLLLLTASGMGTYWSSGGQFRTSEMRRRLGIPDRERLLAAIFIEFPELREQDLERIPGKLREKRCAQGNWISLVHRRDLD